MSDIKMNLESQITSQIIVAQIGCGYWGPNLLRNFATQSGWHMFSKIIQPSKPPKIGKI
jgi:hypothetical protein